MVHDDRTEEGMVLLDEALAAVAGGEVDDFVIVEEIFCQLFAACEHAQDVRRAEQWIRVGEQLAERRNLPGPAPAAVVRCQHKPTSRRLQHAAAPEATPARRSSASASSSPA